MKRMKKKNKMAAFLAAVILMTMSVCQGAFAGETAGIDTARPVSLTIDLEAESKKATISIYKDRKSTRLNSSHWLLSRMPSSA